MEKPQIQNHLQMIHKEMRDIFTPVMSRNLLLGKMEMILQVILKPEQGSEWRMRNKRVLYEMQRDVSLIAIPLSRCDDSQNRPKGSLLS